jgi:arylsulfatase A-like enzyme
VPYVHAGAPWDAGWNPCLPFGRTNDAAECRRRQQACLAFLDDGLRPLLDAFEGATVLVCADHGDAWGEDGIWEHGVYHPAVAAVPLWLRVMGKPVTLSGAFEPPEHPLARS